MDQLSKTKTHALNKEANYSVFEWHFKHLSLAPAKYRAVSTFAGQEWCHLLIFPSHALHPNQDLLRICILRTLSLLKDSVHAIEWVSCVNYCSSIVEALCKEFQIVEPASFSPLYFQSQSFNSCPEGIIDCAFWDCFWRNDAVLKWGIHIFCSACRLSIIRKSRSLIDLSKCSPQEGILLEEEQIWIHIVRGIYIDLACNSTESESIETVYI